MILLSCFMGAPPLGPKATEAHLHSLFSLATASACLEEQNEETTHAGRNVCDRFRVVAFTRVLLYVSFLELPTIVLPTSGCACAIENSGVRGQKRCCDVVHQALSLQNRVQKRTLLHGKRSSQDLLARSLLGSFKPRHRWR